MALIVYLATCFVVGVLGRHRKLGFWGYFFAAVLLSPLIGGLMVLVSDRRPIELPAAAAIPVMPPPVVPPPITTDPS